MNISEAARRMRFAGIFLIAVCALTEYLGAWLGALVPTPNGVELLYLIVIPGTVLWLAGWIFQGFTINAR
jgi:hypothetical protein